MDQTTEIQNLDQQFLETDLMETNKKDTHRIYEDEAPYVNNFLSQTHEPERSSLASFSEVSKILDSKSDFFTKRRLLCSLIA
jgi:hypothetical protein